MIKKSLRMGALFLLVSGAPLLVSCNRNMFSELALRETDSALLFEAKKRMDSSKWTEAIDTIAKMSAGAQARREAKVTLASAYAGRCGLNLVRFANSLSGSGGGTGGLFLLFMNTLRGAEQAQAEDCKHAEETLRSIDTLPANRTVDENLMLTFISFSKMGAILSAFADTDHDGTPDTGFDACDRGQFPELAVREFGTGLTLAIEGLQGSGSSVGASLATAVTAACSTLAGINPDYDFCAITDPVDFTADQVKALSGLIHSQDAPGLRTCASDLAHCVCP